MGHRDSANKEWINGTDDGTNRDILCSNSSSVPIIKTLRHIGKSKSFTSSNKSTIGPEDDRVFAQRLARLCLAKYPGSLAVPPPKKFEEKKVSFRLKRTYSAPAHASVILNQVEFAFLF